MTLFKITVCFLSLFTYAESHPAFIYDKLQNDYISYTSQLLHYLLQEKFQQPTVLTIVRVTNDDFKKPVVESPLMPSRDINPASFIQSAIYEFDFTTFTTFFYSNNFAQESFINSDFVFIVDSLTKVSFRMPKITRHQNRLLTFVTSLQNSSIVQLADEPRTAILTEEDIFHRLDIIEKKTCGVTQDYKVIIIDKITRRMRMIINNNAYPVLHDFVPDGKYHCATALFFLEYDSVKKNDETMKYVQKHPAYTLLSLILSSQKTKLYLLIKSTKGRLIYEDFKETELLQFYYINLYWYSSKYLITDLGKPETLICIGTEDVVWLMVNPTNNPSNWNMVIAIAIGMVLILVGSMLFEHYTDCKYPVQVSLLMMWSIFWTVSIPRQPCGYKSRVLFFSWTLSCSTLTLCYYYKLFSALSNPNIVRHTSTEDIMNDPDVTILIYELSYLQLMNYTMHRNPHSKRPIVNGRTEFFDIIKYYAENHIYFALLLEHKHMEQIFKHISGYQYYYLPNPVMSYPNCIFTTYNGSLSSIVYKKMAQLAATGLVEKITNRFNRDSSMLDNEIFTINLKYMMNIYILIGALYLLATLIFIAELVVAYSIKRKRKQ